MALLPLYFVTASCVALAPVAFAFQNEAAGPNLAVCAETPELVRKGTHALQGTLPQGARRFVRFSPVHCDNAQRCCSAVSTTGSPSQSSLNWRTWNELAGHPRTKVFVQKNGSLFCANITSTGGEVMPAPFIGRASLPDDERMKILRTLTGKFGVKQAAEYAAYEPRVDESLPGQTLIPCGIPNNVCSCSGEVEIHIWEGDPHLSETLAHEATHATL